jgi:hypothetical protein
MTENSNRPTYIYHFRNLPEWLRQSPYAFHLLAEFARRARRIEGDVGWNGENIHLLPRQFITGRIKICRELGLSEGEYRNAYKKLIQNKCIVTIKATKRYTIAEYHADAIFDINLIIIKPSEQPSKLPSNNLQTTTNNNVINENKSRLDNKTEESPPLKEEKSYLKFQQMRKELGL